MKLNSFGLVLLGLLAAPAAYADVIVYGDRGSFDSDNPGLAVEDFEEARVSDGGISAMPNSLDSATDNAIFEPGEILDGLRISTPDNNSADALAIPGAGFAALVPSRSVFGNYFGSGLEAFFYNGDAFSVGLDLYNYAADAVRSISVFGASGLLYSATLNVATSGTFFGISSSEAIARIYVEGLSSYTIGFDNIAFGRSVAVPEPGTLALLSLGLVGLGLGRRRKAD